VLREGGGGGIQQNIPEMTSLGVASHCFLSVFVSNSSKRKYEQCVSLCERERVSEREPKRNRNNGEEERQKFYKTKRKLFPPFGVFRKYTGKNVCVCV
jgi:hypothetical protein